MERTYITNIDGTDLYLRWHQVTVAANIIHKVCGIIVEQKLENMIDTTGYYRIFVTKKYNKATMRDITIAAMSAKEIN